MGYTFHPYFFGRTSSVECNRPHIKASEAAQFLTLLTDSEDNGRRAKVA